MAILPQRHPSLNHARILNHIAPPTRVQSSATAPPKPRRPDSTLATPATTSRPPVLNDPTLQSTWSHRAWLTSGCTTVFVSLAKSVAAAAESHIWLEPIIAGLIGYVLADLGSGVYHWGIDNYGGADTPVFGSQIDGFQGHHKWPWTITRRQFANNLHALARATTFAVAPINLVCDDATALGFVAACSGFIMFSQQFHAWAHTTKSRLPAVVVALQDGGVLVSRLQHAAHHRAPYNNNYCIVSGVWNEILDSCKVFEAMEMVIFFMLGVRPRSWTEPSSAWTEEEAETTFSLSHHRREEIVSPPYLSLPPPSISSKRSATARASEDFMPREPTFQTLHVASVAFNNLLLGEIVVPDWDMFQIHHHTAEFHGATRAVGGCPVYVR